MRSPMKARMEKIDYSNFDQETLDGMLDDGKKREYGWRPSIMP